MFLSKLSNAAAASILAPAACGGGIEVARVITMVYILSLGVLIAAIALLTTGVLSLSIDRYASQAVQ